jgi:hypothetical protein
MSGAGTLILSIDLELDLEHQDNRLQQRLDDLRTRLVDLTKEYRVPATWAVADPALSVATESILATDCGHEIAVLGQRAWLGPGCGRARLGRELARRFAGARKAGIPVGTLALRDVDQILDLDLLLDHGVSAIRGPAVDTPTLARKLGTPPIRFGLWQTPAAVRIPPRTAWWLPAAWAVRHEIKQAIRQQSLAHFEIDAAQIVAAPDHSLGLIAATLEFAAAKREAGLLAIASIGQIAARLLSVRTAAPSRSILQPAA